MTAHCRHFTSTSFEDERVVVKRGHRATFPEVSQGEISLRTLRLHEIVHRRFFCVANISTFTLERSPGAHAIAPDQSMLHRAHHMTIDPHSCRTTLFLAVDGPLIPVRGNTSVGALLMQP